MRKLLQILIIALLAVSCTTTGTETREEAVSEDMVYKSEYSSLTFYIRAEHGSYTLSIPEQLAYFIPLEQSETGALVIPSLDIVMEGSLPGVITFTQRGQEIRLDFSLVSLDGEEFFSRPQEKAVTEHVSEEHLVPLEDGGYLSGSLILSGKERGDTVVLLISGSGIQDRYETIANHRPFYVLSHYLADEGYDVFIYDDRGAGASSPAPTSSDIYLLADEAVQCTDYLTSLGYERLILIGHSQGGNIATMVQCERKAAALILLSTPAVTGLESVLYENRLALLAAGASEAETANALVTLMQTLSYVLNGRSESAEALLGDYFGAEAAKAEIQALSSPEYLSYLGFDPLPYLLRISAPTLALQGTSDTQVTAVLNSFTMLSALQNSGQRFLYTELEGINHLLQRSESGAVTEYGVIEETIAPEVLEAISNFLEDYL